MTQSGYAGRVVPLVVEENRVGTAFGLITAIQNVGLMTFPWVAGRLIDVTHGYTASQVMFSSLGLAGLVLSVGLLAVGWMVAVMGGGVGWLVWRRFSRLPEAAA